MRPHDVYRLTCVHWQKMIVLRSRPIPQWRCNLTNEIDPKCAACLHYKRKVSNG
jgi:hypothetical protein